MSSFQTTLQYENGEWVLKPVGAGLSAKQEEDIGVIESWDKKLDAEEGIRDVANNFDYKALEIGQVVLYSKDGRIQDVYWPIGHRRLEVKVLKEGESGYSKLEAQGHRKPFWKILRKMGKYTSTRGIVDVDPMKQGAIDKARSLLRSRNMRALYVYGREGEQQEKIVNEVERAHG